MKQCSLYTLIIRLPDSKCYFCFVFCFLLLFVWQELYSTHDYRPIDCCLDTEKHAVKSILLLVFEGGENYTKCNAKSQISIWHLI